eukprot:g12465.t1
MLKEARIRAAGDAIPYRLVIDTDDATCWLEALTPQGFERPESSVGKVLELGDGLIFELEGGETEGALLMVRFEPDGVGELAQITISREQDDEQVAVYCRTPTEPYIIGPPLQATELEKGADDRERGQGRRRGFTLVEALASLMLLAVVLPFVVRGANLSARSAADYDRKATAMMLAQTMMEEAILNEAWQFGDSSGEFDDSYGSDAGRYTWSLTSVDWQGTDFLELNLSVYWISGADQKSVELKTVILAVMVTSIVTAGLFASMSGVFKTRRQVEDHLSGRDALRSAVTLLRQDLQCVPPAGGRIGGVFIGEDATGMNSVDADALTYVTANPALKSDQDFADLRQVELRLLESSDDPEHYVLARLVTGNLLATTTPEPSLQVLARRVVSLDLQYYDGGEWLDEWDSTLLDNEVPAAVRVVLTLAPELSQEPEDDQDREQSYLTTTQRAAAYVVAVLVTTVLASLVLVFARQMRAEADASVNQASQIEARWIAQGALEAVRGDLAYVISLGEAPRLDQVAAEAQQLGDGLFWLIKPHPTDDDQLTYGIQGEGGKINLDAFAGIDALELDGMDENLAAAIVDWQDRNVEITPGGAESAYYLSRDTPYQIKDSDMETVGELMYVRGVSEELFHGEDTNRNGRLDPNEDDGDANLPGDNADGELDRGLISYFTVYSDDPGVSDDGQEKVTLDIKSSAQQYNQLRNYIVSALGDEERATELAQLSFNKTATSGKNDTYASVLEFYVETEATNDEFELIHDGLKRLDNDDNLEGLIDVYHASEAVLATLPGLDPGDARAIINARPELDQGEPVPNISWVVDVLGEEKAIAAARYMTHRSYQFTADIVAISGDGRGFCRLRVVLDCLPVVEGDATLPRIRYIEDLTAYGWPLDEAIREQLRSADLVEAKRSGDRVQTLRRSKLSFAPGVGLDQPAALGAALEEHLKANDYAVKQVVIGLCPRWVLTRHKQVPSADADAIRGIVNLQIEREFAVGSSEMAFDYLLSKSVGQGNAPLLLAGVRRSVLGQVREAANIAGLKIEAVTPTPLAAATGRSGVVVLVEDGVAGVVEVNDGQVVAMASCHADPEALNDEAARSRFLADLSRCMLQLPGGQRSDLTLILPSTVPEPDARLIGDAAAERFGQVDVSQSDAADLLAEHASDPATALIDFNASRLAEPSKPKLPTGAKWSIRAAVVALLVGGTAAYLWFDATSRRDARQDELDTISEKAGELQTILDDTRSVEAWYDKRPPVLDCLLELTQTFPTRGEIRVETLTLREDMTGQIDCAAEDSETMDDYFMKMQRSDMLLQINRGSVRPAGGSSTWIDFPISFNEVDSQAEALEQELSAAKALIESEHKVRQRWAGYEKAGLSRTLEEADAQTGAALFTWAEEAGFKKINLSDGRSRQDDEMPFGELSYTLQTSGSLDQICDLLWAGRADKPNKGAWQPPNDDQSAYRDIVDFNIFRSDRSKLTAQVERDRNPVEPPKRTEPTHTVEKPPPNPDAAWRLAGISHDKNGAVAYIENTGSGELARVEGAADFSLGKITTIGYDSIIYVIDENPRVVQVGQTLVGDRVTPPGAITGSGSSGSAPHLAQDTAPAEQTEPVSIEEVSTLTEGLVMNFDQATLKTVLDYLAKESSLVIINEADLQGRVTIFNRQPMSLDDAIDVLNTVLFEEKLTAVRRGKVLKIVSLEDAKRQSIPVLYGNDPEAIPQTDTVVTQVVPIRFANADEIQDDLEDLIDDEFAEMTANQSSNAIIITDTQANIRRLVQIIASLDKSVEKVTEVKVFKLEYADADDTARLIEATFEDSVSENEVVGRLVQQRFSGNRDGQSRRDRGNNNNNQQQNQARTEVSAEADTRTNSIVVSADPETMLKVAEIIEELDADNTAKDSVLIYHVKNMQATDLADIFNNLFEDTTSSSNDQRFGNGGNTTQGGRGTRVQSANAVAATGNAGAADLVGQVSAVANEDTNTVLILTPEKNFPRVQEILDELDKPVPQVLIRVLVSEMTYDDSLDLGVEFEGINVGSTTNDNILTDFDLFDSTLGLNYLMFDGDNFRLAVRALSATGRFDVLSRPYLLTADNQEAEINVGQRVPILTNSRVDESGDIISTIDYEDVGIILTVTPQINSEGLVVMDVSQVISSIADQAIPVAPDQDAVVFNQRELSTQVAVGHGQTVVIGGLVQDELSETVRKVPLIGDIPLLGEFFKRTETSKVKTELLLFLTPEVIETPDQLTPASEKIKSESDSIENAVEPGLMQDHLDKLRATPGNDGPQTPDTITLPEGETEPREGAEPEPQPRDAQGLPVEVLRIPQQMQDVAGDLLRYHSRFQALPPTLKALVQEGVMTQERFDELPSYLYSPSDRYTLRDGRVVILVDSEVRIEGHAWCIVKEQASQPLIIQLNVTPIPMSELDAAAREKR